MRLRQENTRVTLLIRAVRKSTRLQAQTPGKVDGLQTGEEVSVFLKPTEKST